MKKITKLALAAMCIALGAGAFVACGDKGGETPGGNVDDGKITVTFYDGQTVLDTVELDKGSKVERPAADPTKDGYDFVRWCGTPSYSKAFDFNTELEEDTSVFAGFRSQAADNHTWYLAGTSKSGIFKETGEWKDESAPGIKFTPETLPDDVKLEKSADKGNVFTFRGDFFKGDQFQILNTDEGWAGQIGYGYMNIDQYSTETTAHMYGKSSPYDDNSKKQNITIGVSGNYIITLAVDADGKMTEISYEWKGEVENADMIYEYYIIGQKLNEWNTTPYEFTHFATEDHANYTITIGMHEGDMFQLNSYDSDENALRWNPENSKLADDADTKAAISNIANKNFGIKGGTGTYTFTLKLSKDEAKEDVLEISAKKIADTLPEYKFYVKGSIGGDDWSTKREMTKGEDGKYSLEVDIAEGEEFMLVAADKDDINTTVFDITNAYAYKRLVSAGIGNKGNNFVANTADKYTITIDPASMFVTIDGEKDAPRVYCVSAKGTMNGWDVKKATDEQKAVFTDTLTATITMTLEKDDEFMFITYEQSDAACNQIGYVNAGAVAEKPDGISGVQNFKCETAGTYTFTITIDAIGNIVSTTVAKA